MYCLSEERIYCVYRHIFPNGKQYIGITKNSTSRRWGCGSGYMSQPVYNAIKKYGWDNIQHEIVRNNLSKEEAEILERKLIKHYDLRNKDKGYNCLAGGNAPIGTSEVTREFQRKRMLENNPRKGVHLTEEEKARISAANKGRKRTEDQKQKMREHHRDVSGENNPNYGVPCSEEKRNKLIIAHKKCMKPIEQYDLNGVFISRYDSVHDAARQTGFCRTSIRDCCSGRNGVKSTHGFVFKFVEVGGEAA